MDQLGDAPAPVLPMDARWRGILRGETRMAFGPRLGRRAFGLIPGHGRCKFCNAPFRGPWAGVFRRIGYTPSRKNPNICARCIERAPQGGALVQLSVFFADVRGYTSLAEQMSSMEATILLNRFYEVSSAALLSQEAILGQIAGDEVMALFVPGLAGSAYQAKAVEAGRLLLRAVGYGTAEGNWVDIGVGICSGEEFVGNVGGGGFKDFTALGDVTNTAARLQAAASGGEMIMCASTYEALRDRYMEAEPVDLRLKGKQEPVRAYRIRR